MIATLRDFSPDLMRPFFWTPWSMRKTALWLICIAVPLLVATVISAAVSGVAPAMIWAVWVSDFRHLFGISIAHEVDHHDLGWPLWRDLVSIFAILAMAWTPLNAAFQARGFRHLLSHMQASGALHVPGDPARDTINRFVDSANRVLRLARFASPFVFLAWIASCVALYVRLGDAYDAHSPSDWWVLSNGAIPFLFVVVCAVGLATSTMQNIGAIVIIVAIFRIRKLVDAGADLSNADRRWGWWPVGAAVGAAYRDITVHGLALIGISLAIRHDDQFWWSNIALLVLSMCTAPFYIGIPLAITVRRVVAFRRRELALLDDTARGSSAFSLDHVARVDRLNALPTVPWLRLRNIVGGIAAQIVNVPAVVAFGIVVVRLVNGQDPLA